MSSQLHLHLMQTNTAEIARNAEAGRHGASLRRREVKRDSSRTRGLGRLLLPVLRHS